MRRPVRLRPRLVTGCGVSSSSISSCPRRRFITDAHQSRRLSSFWIAPLAPRPARPAQTRPRRPRRPRSQRGVHPAKRALDASRARLSQRLRFARISHPRSGPPVRTRVGSNPVSRCTRSAQEHGWRDAVRGGEHGGGVGGGVRGGGGRVRGSSDGRKRLGGVRDDAPPPHRVRPLVLALAFSPFASTAPRRPPPRRRRSSPGGAGSGRDRGAARRRSPDLLIVQARTVRVLKLGGEPLQAVNVSLVARHRTRAPSPGRPPRVERVAGDAKLDLPSVERSRAWRTRTGAAACSCPTRRRRNRELLARGDVGDARDLDVAPSIFFVPASFTALSSQLRPRRRGSGGPRLEGTRTASVPDDALTARAQRPRELFQRDASAARKERRVRVAHELRPAQHAPVRRGAPERRDLRRSPQQRHRRGRLPRPGSGEYANPRFADRRVQEDAAPARRASPAPARPSTPPPSAWSTNAGAFAAASA